MYDALFWLYLINSILLINHEPDYGNLRWTVDTPQDLELLRLIYDRFEGRDDFSSHLQNGVEGALRMTFFVSFFLSSFLSHIYSIL